MANCIGKIDYNFPLFVLVLFLYLFSATSNEH